MYLPIKKAHLSPGVTARFEEYPPGALKFVRHRSGMSPNSHSSVHNQQLINSS